MTQTLFRRKPGGSSVAVRALLAIPLIVTIAGLASGAHAQALAEVIRWTHPGTGIAGFRVYTSPDTGSFSTTPDYDISIAEVGVNQAGEYFAALNTSQARGSIFVVVTAYDTQGVESLYSNQNTIVISMDRDGDGFNDDIDAFPDDPTEWLDSDGDGVGDNRDHFPNDPSEDTDSDGDGYGNNADVFPNDPYEWSDRDGDGVGDNADAFPNDPSRSASSIVLSPYRVNVGSDSEFTDFNGKIWTRDAGFFNTGFQRISSSSNAIAGTLRAPIYRSSRTGPPNGEPMIFRFPLRNGNYRVVLHFNEDVYNRPGDRVFDVDIEGLPVLEGFDLQALPGGKMNRAAYRTFFTEVVDGNLEITFRHNSGVGGPTVMGIEVVSSEAVEGKVLTSPGRPFVIDIN